MSWRRFNVFGAVATSGLWIASEIEGWVNLVSLVNRLSFPALIISFVAAWRADVPTKPDTEGSSKNARGGANEEGVVRGDSRAER